MPLTTTSVTFKLSGIDAAPAQGVKLSATLSCTQVDDGIVVQTRVFGLTDDEGLVTLNLWPNTRGDGTTFYTIRHGSDLDTGLTPSEFFIVVPETQTGTAHGDDLIVSVRPCCAPYTSPSAIAAHMQTHMGHLTGAQVASGAEFVTGVTDGGVLLDGYGNPIQTGGGDEVVAGAGISITTNPSGQKVVANTRSVAAGDGIAIETSGGVSTIRNTQQQLVLAAGAGISITTNPGGQKVVANTRSVAAGDGIAIETSGGVSTIRNTQQQLVLAAGAGITVVTAAGTSTVACTISQYTNQMAIDAVYSALSAGTGIAITRAGNVITIRNTLAPADFAYVAYVNRQQMFTKGQSVEMQTLIDDYEFSDQAQASYVPDVAWGNTSRINLVKPTGFVANPANSNGAMSIGFHLVQDATGGRLLTWGTKYKWPSGRPPALSTSPNARDFVQCIRDSDSDVWCCQIVKDFS